MESIFEGIMPGKRPNYGSNVPLAREKLLAIAIGLEASGSKVVADEIREIERNLLRRRRGSRSAPAQHPKPTSKQVKDVRHLGRSTNLSQQEIADQVDLNPGRVSEILSGLRDADGEIK